MSVRIRAARADEIPMLEDLQRRASLGNPGDRDALLAHPDAISLPPAQVAQQQVFVAETEKDVLGFAAVVERDDGDAELDALFVDPQFWRKGVGRRLVEHCAAVASARNARSLHVVGNPHAEEFYLSIGFETVGVEETRFGPALRMRKPLQPSARA